MKVTPDKPSTEFKEDKEHLDTTKYKNICKFYSKYTSWYGRTRNF